ncbi:MAG TPA: ribose ABC transporter permease [Ruminococcaceae bacterium]|nr:ribose ABC transporter permease [Oscillospiraceae bacterium]
MAVLKSILPKALFKKRPYIREYKNEIAISLLIIVVFVVSQFLSPVFLSADNLLNLLRQTAYTAIAAIGMYFVILIGGIDLSIGATVQIVGMVSIMMMVDGVSIGVTIAAALAVGLLVGLLNGIIVTYGRLQPFVVTLVTRQIMQGIVLVASGGASISGDVPDTFMQIGAGYIGFIPVPVVVMFVIAVAAFFMMRKTTFGRRLYITGSNQTAAYYSGTNVRRVKVLAYVLCALFATVSGLLSVARIGAFQPTTTHGGAAGMELNAIAAVVVGGASLSGGKGSIVGTLLGAVLYGILSNLFPLIGISSYIQQLIQGFIILMAVLISSKGKILRVLRKEGAKVA